MEVEEMPIVLQEYDQEKKIYVLSLNRPKQLNAVSIDLLHELRHHLETITNVENVGALIINSKLTKAFCTGIDVTYVQSLSNEEAAAFFADLQATFDQISNFPCPTIAAINGYAFGAGADLALACDIRIAGESSRFRFPGPQFGVVLGTHRLANEAGHSVARKLALTNQLLSADEALGYGIIHEVTDVENVFETALTQARNITNMPEFTFKTIREICTDDSQSENKNITAIEYTRQSIEQGNFQERFSQYVARVKERKRK